MDNTQNTSPEGTGTSTEGKTFTQEDVNRIVQERLAKEKSKGNEELDKRAKELDAREFRMKATETLKGKGYPPELLDAINCTSEETLNSSIEIIDKIIKERVPEPTQDKRRAKFTAPMMKQDQGDFDLKKAFGIR